MSRTTVQVAELKAKLSEVLRGVRRGRSVTVLHRDTPIARLVPYDPTDRLRITKAAGKVSTVSEVPLPPPLGLQVDILKLLEEERQSRR
ncbi:MAG TPA: type II toxin-antitoxin system prevent-host-death family antitoxin [Methylomirabilota bacterium]